MAQKTNNVRDIIDVTARIGDDHVDKYDKNGQSKDAQTALDAYKLCISASKAQLMYKKLTGDPVTISFLE